ncbi:lysostaphin resistance A-like protein [Methanobrevibacter gottschalkii]|uniref:CPBP family intramembrane glutamic endopeptidase n=1 Tax=Methanobrevibacter gottschalkii TaxID=190974 RepID=UPI00350E59DA
MSLFNEKIKLFNLKDLFVFVLFIFLVKILCISLNWSDVDLVCINIVIILFFTFKLRGCFSSFKQDLLKVFTFDSLKLVFLIVILNIFVSYGLLYLSNFILKAFPFIRPLISSSVYINNSALVISGFIATVFISPISEELIFRGVLLNKLRLIVPLSFSIVISSLLFCILHSFGSMTAAFIFAVCMAILYLKTDNVLIPIFAHFLNNLIAEMIVVIDTGNVLFTNDGVMMIISILAIVCGILIFIFIKNQWDSLNINNL